MNDIGPTPDNINDFKLWVYQSLEFSLNRLRVVKIAEEF